jgi:hypothetical protein
VQRSVAIEGFVAWTLLLCLLDNIVSNPEKNRIAIAFVWLPGLDYEYAINELKWQHFPNQHSSKGQQKGQHGQGHLLKKMFLGVGASSFTFGPSGHTGPTKQRLSGFSHARQCGDEVLRILVTGGPPNFGGGGMPHLIKVISRSVPAFRTTGAG